MYTEPGKGRVHVATWIAKGGDKTKVYVDDFVDHDEVMKFDLAEGRMEYVPVIDKNQRCCFYVTGSSGSGKSTWISDCLKKLIKVHKKKETWLFSSILDYDPVYMDKGERMLKKVDYDKVPLEDIIPNDLITYKDGVSQGCIAVFDDYDGNAKGKKLQPLVNQVLKEGRKLGEDVFLVSHQPRDYMRTREIINQATTFVCFPATNKQAMLGLAKAYWDISDKKINHYLDAELPIQTRFYFVAYNKFPKTVVTSDRIYQFSNTTQPNQFLGA